MEINVEIPKHLMVLLRERVKKQGVTIEDIITRAIEKFMDRGENNAE